MSTFDRSSWPERERPAGSLSVAEALRGLPLAPRKGMEEVHLATVVAATLRAAAEVLMGPEAGRPLSVAWDDGALDVLCPLPAQGDVAAAASLLQTVDGSIGLAERERAWMIRVPVLGPRALYLMVEQGTLGLAVPWHAVIHVRMASRATLEATARRAGHAVLSPLVQVPNDAEERPALLLGHGVRRAYLLADRLVWRMPAELVEGGAAPGPDLARAVRTADGEVYWVADPARLLREVPPPPIPERVIRSTPSPEAPEAGAEPPAKAREPRDGGGRPASGPGPRLVELRREDVVPLGESESGEGTGLAPAVAGGEHPAVEPPEPPAPAPRSAHRVLVAEDSIVGRIFLQRLLELRGFQVESVGTARELLATLPFGPWVLVFADVDLPDSPRGSHLEGLSRSAAGSIVVALVRDAEDQAAAAAAGVARSLRKPFEQAPLQRLLHELGLEGARR